jgi:hypothetical protein
MGRVPGQSAGGRYLMVEIDQTPPPGYSLKGRSKARAVFPLAVYAHRPQLFQLLEGGP